MGLRFIPSVWVWMGKPDCLFIPAALGIKPLERYRPIFSKVNEKLLKKMADETGGEVLSRHHV